NFRRQNADQTITKDLSTSVSATYLMQTADDPAAFIIFRMKGWLTGAKEVLEKVQDPSVADTVNPSTYKFRVTIELETGDERFAFVNNLMWVGSACRRANEGG
ncbi:hypothetical protein KEM55_001138, partial [Ascosphaera atra]